MQTLEKRIFEYSGTTNGYISFANLDGKKWVIAKNYIQSNLSIYQPSSKKGKLLKRILPVVSRIGIYPAVLHVKECSCRITPEIIDFIEKVFQCKELTLSAFLGTPGVHQKTVIQVNKGSTILGYCKVSDSDVVYANFIKEMKILNQLQIMGCRNIPIGLTAQRIMKDEIGVFIQTTTKTTRSRICHRLEERHVSFIQMLCMNTLRPIVSHESGIYRDIAFLKEIPEIQVPFGETISQMLMELDNGPQMFCLNHGDFTPWNTYIEKGQLCVFDWEYAETEYLPMLDVFHFFTQVCYFEKHMSAGKIVEEYLRLKHGEFDTWISWTGYGSDILYLCYLLSMISRTLQRENELTEASKKSIDLWFQIIRALAKEAKSE